MDLSEYESLFLPPFGWHATCRAYKLGKRRWSYNQCELQLLLDDQGSSSKQPVPLCVTEAVLIKGMETEASCNVSICNWQASRLLLR